jgi:hypothetical protein
MRGRGFAVGVRGHGSGEGERPGEMEGPFDLRCVLRFRDEFRQESLRKISTKKLTLFVPWVCRKPSVHELLNAVSNTLSYELTVFPMANAGSYIGSPCCCSNIILGR